MWILPACAPKQTPVATPIQSNPEENILAEGQRIYGRFCARCHMANGEGGGPYEVPALRSMSRPAYEVQAIVEAGSRTMPSFKGFLTPLEIQAVAKYVVSLKNN